MERHFLNLTNGIEFLPELQSRGITPDFVRIQSTWCEQKLFWPILADLDYTFLIPAVAGAHCVVYDASNGGEKSRAIWQGLAWVKFALDTYVQDVPARAVVARGGGRSAMDVTPYFRDQLGVAHPARSAALGKLAYLRKFSNFRPVSIHGVGRRTTHDGQYAHYRSILVPSLASPDPGATLAA